MNRLISLVLALTCSTTMMTAKTKTIELQLIGTSDVHGAFFPYDFIERRPMAGTMARVSSYVSRQRRKYGNRLVLLEGGDILQGQPTCYYTNYVKPDEPNVAAAVVNYLGYDAAAFGNHDIETGHAVYDKWVSELRCPVLGANVIDTRSQQPYTAPYTVIEREGVRIAILGMLTPAIPNWLNEQLWSGLHFEEMVASARQWMQVLRAKEHPDLIVGLFHSGWDGGISTLHYDEDATRKVAEQIEGFDVIFFGHDHTERNVTTDKGVVCLNPSCNAVNVAQATVRLTLTDGRVTAKQIDGRLVNITGEAVDQAFVAHFQPQIDSISSYVNRRIGTFAHTIRTRDCFFGPAAFTDFIHDLQLQVTGADISFNAPLTFDSDVQAGPVYISDMFKLYRYENQIYTLRMTGAEIRKHLEMSYDQWVNTMQTADDPIMLLTTYTDHGQQRVRFKNLTFNFDSAAGIDYEVDVTRPDGQKVRILQMSSGEPFDESKWYRVAMNSYRGNGGGALLTSGAGIPADSVPARIVWQSERDQRYYLTRYIEQAGTVSPQAHTNWCFAPLPWALPALQRDRRLLFNE